jgi:uncharacterized protein (DUF1697 family)
MLAVPMTKEKAIHPSRMTSHIALLRSINVGNNTLKMERLRNICQDLGFADVRTYVQSGNVLFSSRDKSSRLSELVENKLHGETRLPVSVIVKTVAQWKRVVDGNPFLKAAGTDLKTLHVTFLTKAASKAGLSALAAIESGADRWHAAADVVYLHCPNGYGRTKISNTAIEKKLALRATTRNWTTVQTLYQMAQP